MKQKDPQTLSMGEIEALLRHLSHHGKSDYSIRKALRNSCITLLMLDAGLRVGEMLNLIVSDLIIEGQPVSEIRIRKETAKYGSERYIPVSGRLRTILLDMYIFCWKAGQFSPSNYAFISDRVCNHITITQVERIIDSAGLKALQRHLHPHMLRHTFATRLMRVSNIRVVQQLLGHKYLTSTQIYTHPDSTDLRTAIEATQTSV